MIHLLPHHGEPLRVAVTSEWATPFPEMLGRFKEVVWARYLPARDGEPYSFECHWRRCLWRTRVPVVPDNGIHWALNCMTHYFVRRCYILTTADTPRYDALGAEHLVVGWGSLPRCPHEASKLYGASLRPLFYFAYDIFDGLVNEPISECCIAPRGGAFIKPTPEQVEKAVAQRGAYYAQMWHYAQGHVQDLQGNWLTKEQREKQYRERAEHDAEERRRFPHRG